MRNPVYETGPESLIRSWLKRCLSASRIESCIALNLKSKSEREIWKCTFKADGLESTAILAIFKPGSLESVNTSLPPAQTAVKCALAMTELPAYGVPTPGVLGHAVMGSEAALLCEWVEQEDWAPEVRIEAARILARIHKLQESSLSYQLQGLLRISDPREFRTTGGEAPPPSSKVLVHGDYFSLNILPVGGGLRIIDWETFGWGDPMWDLGFLVGADRDLPHEEIEATIAAYASCAPLDREQLLWHQKRWSSFWLRRSEDRRPER